MLFRSGFGYEYGEYGRRDPEMGKKNLEEIDKLASEGKLNPHIHKTYSLDNTVDALNELRNRTVIGKVCIKPNEPKRVYDIALYLSEFLGISIQEIADATSKNAMQFFNID